MRTFEMSFVKISSEIPTPSWPDYPAIHVQQTIKKVVMPASRALARRCAAF